MAGSRALSAREPGQVRKEAALSGSAQAPRTSLAGAEVRRTRPKAVFRRRVHGPLFREARKESSDASNSAGVIAPWRCSSARRSTDSSWGAAGAAGGGGGASGGRTIRTAITTARRHR